MISKLPRVDFPRTCMECPARNSQLPPAMDDDPQPQSMLVCMRQRSQCKHSQYPQCKQRWWRYLSSFLGVMFRCPSECLGFVFEKNRMMHGQNNSRARIAAQAWIRQPLQLTNSTIRLVIRGSALTIIDLHPYISKSLFSWQISCFFFLRF